MSGTGYCDCSELRLKVKELETDRQALKELLHEQVKQLISFEAQVVKLEEIASINNAMFKEDYQEAQDELAQLRLELGKKQETIIKLMAYGAAWCASCKMCHASHEKLLTDLAIEPDLTL